MCFKYWTIKYLILLINVISAYEFAAFNLNEDLFENIETCAAKLLKTFHSTRMVYFQGKHLDISTIFHRNSSLIQINTYEEKLLDTIFPMLYHYSFYIFEISPDLSKFNETLMQLQASQYFNGSARTLVLYPHLQNIDAIFKLLWNVRLVNSVLIDADAYLYTYNPITEGNCNNSIPKQITKCGEDYNATLFTESDVLYFTNCTLRAYAMQNIPYIFNTDLHTNAGLDAKVLALITNALQMNTIFLDHKYIGKISQAISARLGDIGLGGLILKRDHRPRTVSPITHAYLEMGFYVPYAEIKSPWLNIIQVFDPIIWTCVFIFLTITPLLLRFILHRRFKLHEYYFHTYRAFITATTIHAVNKLKLFNLSWVWMCFLILNTYQCTLVSQLFKPKYEKQISTIRELVESDLDIGGNANFTQIMDSESKDMININSRFRMCSLNGMECIHRSFHKKDFAYFKNTRSVNYQLRQLNMSLFLVEPVIVIPSVMIMLKGNPFLARFNVMLRRLQETGFVDHWDVYKNVYHPESSDDPPPIFLEQLFVIFIVYILGLSFAALRFWYELRNDPPKEIKFNTSTLHYES